MGVQAESEFWHQPEFPADADATTVALLEEVLFKYELSCSGCKAEYTDVGVRLFLPNGGKVPLTYEEVLAIGKKLVDAGYYDDIVALDNAGLYGESKKSALLLREIIIKILTDAQHISYLRKIELR